MSSTNYKSELVGVFGHPVSENPTIVMQEAGFKALGLNWRYLNIEVLPEDLEQAVQGLRAMNFAGINCTIPHKVAVLEFLDDVAPDARLIGAVNTIVRDGNKLIGHNTDGKGFIRALADANLVTIGHAKLGHDIRIHARPRRLGVRSLLQRPGTAHQRVGEVNRHVRNALEA